MARPKEFDRDEALGRAMKVFWSRGYDGTSIDDLVKGTGVGRQSLYDTFGDKHAIYLAALDLYRRTAGKDAVVKKASPLATLEASFRRMARAAVAGEGERCMMIDAALEIRHSPSEEVERALRENLRANERIIRDLLQAAEGAGEIPQGLDHRAIARTMLNAIHGLRVTAPIDHGMLEDVVRHTLASIR
ncbi:MAG: TetR/AcrR family transcriptional regulator [Polyangiales bacterium]